MIRQLLKKILRNDKFNSINYWENRYAGGGNSGDGSYGRLSMYKAKFINEFLKENKIQSTIEMGCGDGHQLSIINYTKYTGIDVSPTIIELCTQKFAEDKTKQFVLYKPGSFVPNESLKADLALSLDVLYHIVEEKNYLKYLDDLFGLGKKFVVIYSTNFHLNETQHVLHRKFTDYVERLFPNWKLVDEVANPFPGNGEQESKADFFVFARQLPFDSF